MKKRWLVQHNNWTCGPYALRHAMLTYGIDTDPRALERQSHCIKGYGTSSRGLMRGAKRYGFRLGRFWVTDEAVAKTFMVNHLRFGGSVIIAVDKEQHWVAATAYSNNRFQVADSGSRPVCRYVTWAYIKRRLISEQMPFYDMFPLYKR